MQETWVQSFVWEDPLEKGTATHSSILAWRIPWTEEPGGLQSMGSQESAMTKRLSLHFIVYQVIFLTRSQDNLGAKVGVSLPWAAVTNSQPWWLQAAEMCSHPLLQDRLIATSLTPSHLHRPCFQEGHILGFWVDVALAGCAIWPTASGVEDFWKQFSCKLIITTRWCIQIVQHAKDAQIQCWSLSPTPDPGFLPGSKLDHPLSPENLQANSCNSRACPVVSTALKLRTSGRWLMSATAGRPVAGGSAPVSSTSRCRILCFHFRAFCCVCMNVFLFTFFFFFLLCKAFCPIL